MCFLEKRFQNVIAVDIHFQLELNLDKRKDLNVINPLKKGVKFHRVET